MNTQILFKKLLKCSSAFFLFLLCSSAMTAQNLTISGTITESEGQTPLPGVNIVEKGTSNGVSADFDGNYSLTVSNQNAVLVVSFVGYETQEISVDGRTTIDIVLDPSAEALDEIVLIGYGSIKKKDVTGAVSFMGEEQITERSIGNPIASLQGMMPGVNISSNTGRIGDGFKVEIRGQTSLRGDGDPLYVVDGTPMDNIEFLNPEDIARIDVLKDASSAAIYGSRGANGVLIVTTKSGSSAKGGMTVSFDTYYGVREIARMPEMMSGEKWWYYHQSAYLATTNLNDPMSITPEELHGKVVGGSNSMLEARANANETFDWYDAVLQTGSTSNNYVAISGRAENGMGYNIGLGYQKEVGNIENEGLDKFNFRTSVDHKVNDKWTVGGSIAVSKSDIERGNSNAMRDAFRLNPFTNPWAVDENNESIVGEYWNQPGKLRDVDGNYLINKTSTWNPLLQIKGTADETRRWNMVGNFNASYKPLEWLTLRTNFSSAYDARRRGIAYGPSTSNGASTSGIQGSVSNVETFNYTWDNQFNIDHTFNEDHKVGFLGVVSMYSTQTEGSDLSSTNMPFDTGFYNLGSGAQSSFNIGSFYHEESLLSYTARLNYAYKGKYLVTVTSRWDGSSLFAEGNKWAMFPSAAFAWRVSEEGFMQNQNVVSDLKARISYGLTGNNNIDPYSAINILDDQKYYDFDGSAANGWYAGSLSNAALEWEKTEEINFGVDFGFLNNRITGSIDIYDKDSKDVIQFQRLPLEIGKSGTDANVARISNKGFEVALQSTIIQTDLITWDLSVNFAKNKNEVLEINGQSINDDVGNGLFIGEELGSYYNYVFDGIWQADERAEAATYNQLEGQAKVKDINGDGVISPDDDRVILGTRNPDWTGGLNTRLLVGDFDLSISMITAQGVYAYSRYHENFTNTRDRGRQKADIDWYIPENGAGIPAQFSNSYPQPRNMGTYWRNSGVGYYRDASYTKIKNIAVGYTLDNVLPENAGIKNLRVYANIIDPFVFTDYDGYDPEWATAGFGVARVASVTYQLGLSLKF